MLVLLGELMLSLMPIPFLVLAIAAYRLDGREVSEPGQKVVRAMQLGPTIYPLIFAGVAGRCIRNLAQRKAEIGTTIEVLEKLVGSQSLVSTVSSAFALRSFNALSIYLLLLWSLSPLGGQSSLRLLSETNTAIFDNSVAYCASPDSATFMDGTFDMLSLINISKVDYTSERSCI
ncbi:hypothetical protein K491DRAFT_689580 [Lophiostoma macrostomum CBS 122681]|uniref:Uncharacterized protein n=1 Tax=Lophiostoma macrostomum CBS 122681 TaxID=1314788 RepID=A0A6A6THR3_9PLEO|nr:hypothetical protein K491DRAFT_689580 [Lophiostoma macrostomum CBS 122681]